MLQLYLSSWALRLATLREKGRTEPAGPRHWVLLRSCSVPKAAEAGHLSLGQANGTARADLSDWALVLQAANSVLCLKMGKNQPQPTLKSKSGGPALKPPRSTLECYPVLLQWRRLRGLRQVPTASLLSSSTTWDVLHNRSHSITLLDFIPSPCYENSGKLLVFLISVFLFITWVFSVTVGCLNILVMDAWGKQSKTGYRSYSLQYYL